MPRARSPRRPTRAAEPPGVSSRVPNDTRTALPYVIRWHRTLEWAERAVWGFPGFDPVTLPKGKLNGRVEQLSATCVRDLKDAEEAYSGGVPLEYLDNLPRGPRRELGGFRRVLVTALTWVPDDAGEVGYDAAWITLGWGMTAHEAGAATHRFVQSYANQLRRGIESRRLILTALEVKFWTASEAASYV